MPNATQMPIAHAEGRYVHPEIERLEGEGQVIFRYCDAEGRLNLVDKGPPGTQSQGSVPWFSTPGRRSREVKFVVGHWASLGVHREAGVQALDSGCAWGRRLTAMRLDVEEELVSIACDGC